MQSLRIATLFSVAATFTLTSACSAWEANPDVLKAQQKRVEVINKVAPSVVAIFGPGGGGGGSGVLVSPDGYAVTNFHVTNGAGTFMKCGLNDGVLYDAVIVGIDPTGDVAVIKLLGRNDFPHSPLGDSDKVEVGDWAYAMGNPFLLATDFRPTVTYGIVSGVHRYQYPAGTFLEYTDCIQIDTSINPGNSGGPLFNEDGEVVGINGRGSFEKRGRVNSGAGYAISSNQVSFFLGHLKSGRIVDHATLGATVYSADDGSVLVSSILENSEAYRRGLREDDEIVSFAGRNIRSVNQFKNILGIYPKGWNIPLTYRRNGKKTDVVVKLRALHRKSEMTGKKKPQAQPQPQPKPDDKKPGDGKPDDKKPKPPTIPLGKPQPKAPAKYKHMYVKKEGFANYYFNKVEQDRLLAELAKWGDFTKLTGEWKLTGTAKDQTSVEFTLKHESAGVKWGEALFYQPFDGSDIISDPPQSGGLLVAAHQLRYLLTTKGYKFTEFYYLGTEPLDGDFSKMTDVLVSVLTGVTTYYYFDQKDGTLLGFDTQIEQDSDACEVRFSEVKDLNGVKLPTVWNVKHGDQPFTTLTFTKGEYQEGPVTEAKPEEEKQPDTE